MKPHENDICWGILSLVVGKYRFLKRIFVYFLLCWVSVPVWALSGCGELGLPSGLGAWASHCRGSSCCEARSQWLWRVGVAALWLVESSWARD